MQIRMVDGKRDSPFIEVAIRDIGEGGLSFYSESVFSTTKKYEIHLALREKVTAVGLVRILWSRDGSEGKEHGLYFSDVTPDFFDDLEDFMDYLQQNLPARSLPDRRERNRRLTGSSSLYPSLENRKIERRSGIRLKEREGLADRVLSDEIKRLLNRRVVVTGLGMVTPIGIGKDRFLHSLRTGVSGIKPITRFNPEPFACRLAGEVRDFKASDYMNHRRASRMELATQMGLVAAILGVQDACLDLGRENHRRIGVSMGTTMGGLIWSLNQDDIFEQHGPEAMHPYTIAAASPNACSGEISSEMKARGPCVSFAQGCSSSAGAITYAFDQIRHGNADIMLTGGCEAPLYPSIYGAFSKSGILSRTVDGEARVPRPFAKSRNGVILAEGAGVLVLEELDHAIARGATIYAELLGWANTCDGHDMVNPHASGTEAARSMNMAIEDAGLSPSDIDIVFTHAAGSKVADSLEIKGLRQVFRRHLRDIFVANIKSMNGYPQGASTAIETAAACLSLRQGFVPPVLNTTNPELPLNISDQAREAPLRTALVNCFGFGGKNICLVLRRDLTVC